jgi:predicted TPR repeat methyltransferase
MTDTPDERPITVSAAMELVLEALQNGQFEEAAEVCGKILGVAPEHPAATHYAGVIAHEDGRTDEALSLIERSLKLDPDQPDWYSNLGIVRQARGDLEGAIEAYRHAIALEADHANAHGNLGVLLKVQGNLVEAEAEYRKTIELNPKHADAYHNLAVLLSATDRATEAVTCYCRALTLKPHYPEARRAMALAYCMLGQRDRAVQVCEEWIKDDPHSVVAKHTLAACSGKNVPPRASNEYVQRVFDSFASSFEAKLARLQYRAPTLVVDALAETGIPADKSRDVLDVGCGTGLCGPLLAPYARNLVGIDLSGGMLNHAAEKRIYDDLIQAELTAYLQQLPHRSYDVIVTADTLVYFGGLEEVIDAAALALRPGGVFIFTVEEATEPERADSYSIQPHGRFSHGAAYVERLLVGAGLQPTIGRAELRLESGVPVAGLVVRGARPGGAGLSVAESTAHAAAAGEHHG